MEGGVPDADISAFRECLSLSWKNPYILRLAFSAGIGGLLFGYDTGNYLAQVMIHKSCLCNMYKYPNILSALPQISSVSSRLFSALSGCARNLRDALSNLGMH
jgi:hypothetical protein